MRPGSTTGSGWAARNVSTIPMPSTASPAGQATGYFICGSAPTVAGVQSRCDGLLKSPVTNSGIPLSMTFFQTGSRGSSADTRVSCSLARTSASVDPSRTSSGPYGSDGRWTLAIATTCPGAICR